MTVILFLDKILHQFRWFKYCDCWDVGNLEDQPAHKLVHNNIRSAYSISLFSFSNEQKLVKTGELSQRHTASEEFTSQPFPTNKKPIWSSRPSGSWACRWTVPYWDPVLLLEQMPWVLGLSCHPGRMQRDGTLRWEKTTQNNTMKMVHPMKYSQYSVSTNSSFEAPKTKFYKLLKNRPIEAIAASHHPPKAVSFPDLKFLAEFRCTLSDKVLQCHTQR